MAETFSTTDLGLASLLFAQGISYVGLKQRPGDWKVEFQFTQPEDTRIPTIDACTAGWQDGTMKVGALAMWNASRKLAREVKRRERENS